MMRKLFRIMLEDESTPISARLINLIAFYIELCAVAGLVIFTYIKMDMGLIVSILAMIVLVAVVWTVSRIAQNRMYAAYFFAYAINMLILPMFFIFGGGLNSGMAMLFSGGFILTFLLLEGVACVVAVVIQGIWYTFVIAFAYYFPEKIASIPQGVALLIDVLFCFVVASIVAAVILAVYGRIYNTMRSSVEASMRMIQETSIVKSRFLANMSHELRTPMNAILGMAELLERDEKNSSIAYEIKMIKDSAFSLLTTINNVLTYSKLDSRKLDLAPQQFNFSKLLKDVIYTINLEILDKNIQLFTDIDPDIPDVLYGDDARIRQIFHYILFNAVRDTDDGRIAMEISFKHHPKKNKITLYARITDTGIGLTDDEQNSLFSSFEIYDSRKNSQLKRIGLELTICRDMLALMNGNISVESITGVGTSVYIDFEVFQADRGSIVSIDRIRNEKALIYIEDRETRTQAWNNLAGQFGVVPMFANSPAAFEARIRERHFDYIFISADSLPILKDILSTYNCIDNVWVITDLRHVYGDFGKCKILRNPVSCLNLSEVFNGTWDADDYKDKENIESFKAPDARILIVDDNMVNLKVAAGLLSKYDILPALATSGNEAIDRCQRAEFDLILMDQLMPEMDGFQTLSAIRKLPGEHNQKVPIVCLTATIGSDIREELLRKGFQEYLAKPIKTRYLEDVLRTFLPKDRIVIASAASDANDYNSFDGATSIEEGFVPEQGLDRTGGDMGVYTAILNTYCREGVKKIEDIIDEYNSGDIPLFVINVHAVKGSSASIGAPEVSELFRQLEMAGKDNDTEFIDRHLDNAIDKYKAVLSDIHDYLVSQNALEDDGNTGGTLGEEVDFDIDTMRALHDYIEDFNTELFEGVFAEWDGKNFGAEINNYVSSIKKAIDSFDYDMALSFVDEFIEVFS